MKPGIFTDPHYSSAELTCRKSLHGGIEYVTFPAMCENEKAYFAVEI